MFLVNAPAGSGKTTYIENTIINLLAQYPNRRILTPPYLNLFKSNQNASMHPLSLPLSPLSDASSAVSIPLPH